MGLWLVARKAALSQYERFERIEALGKPMK